MNNIAENTVNTVNTEKTNVSSTAQVGEILGKFYPYDSTNPPLEASDSRIVKIIVRQRKNGSNETDTSGSKYVRVPNSHIVEDTVKDKLEVLLPYFVDYLLGIEDNIIKEQYKKGVTSIYTDGLSLDRVVNYLEEQESSSRLNGEVIADWFDKELKEYLQVAFAEKLGLDSPDDMKLVPVLEAYLNKFKSIASPKTSLVEEDREALLKVLKLSEADKSVIGKRIVKRIENMKEKESDLLLSL